MTDEDGFTFYVVTNYRGDVVRITDTSGQEVASYSYDPWGKVLSTTESTKLTNQPLRYASYVYDTETELYYLQARYYDQNTARFISRDPNGGDKDNPLSQNAYAYANADPVNNVDPDGRMAEAIALGGSGLAAAYGTGAALSWNPLGWVILGTAAVATIYLGYQIYNAHGEKGKTFRGGKKKDRDQWYGHKGKDFQKWWERVGKKEWGGRDIANKKMADEVYDTWVGRGKPKTK